MFYFLYRCLYLHTKVSLPITNASLIRLSFLPIHFLRSIPSISSPPAFSTLSLDPFFYPSLLLLISCSSFSHSPVEVPSSEHTFFPVFFYCLFDTSCCCLHLLLYIVIVFHHLLPISTFFHASFCFSLFPVHIPILTITFLASSTLNDLFTLHILNSYGILIFTH
jgi:hypothetical protein